MYNMMKRFWNEEDGSLAVELCIILGVLVAVAVLFKDKITEWVNALLNKTGLDVAKATNP